MAKRRKDKQGRILKTGESQRKDLIYQYRYTDKRGKRHSIYDSDLKSLREKEKTIEKEFDSDLNIEYRNITVIELVERYLALKRSIRDSTNVVYESLLNTVKRSPFGNRFVTNIRTSDAKMWFIELNKQGMGYRGISNVKGIVRPAFQMAIEEDVIVKNPFDFKLSDVVVNDTQTRIALTKEQEQSWLDFIKNDKHYKRYYDEYVVLLGTGLRVSEFCGLTIDDLEFDKRRINVDHQLRKSPHGKRYISTTKTKSGCRYIPMSNDVYCSLKNIIANRNVSGAEITIDGYNGFLFLDINGKPKVASHIQAEIREGLKKYRSTHPEDPLPNITPHVLRHTFCTNMALKGMDPKALQYVMGHSNIRVTMDVYTHITYEYAEDEFRNMFNGE